jgi:16S rRNA (cytosine1402-N4)-methyltransferase
LAKEVLQLLQLKPGMIVVDGTLGGGGHALLMAEAVGPSGRVIGLDRDGTAIRAAAAHLADYPIEALHASYAKLPEALDQLGIEAVSAVLLDLGLSSDQLASTERGFSFRRGGDLDMRFDDERGEPAKRLLSRLSEKHLADLIYEYGDERYSRRIAKAIVNRRRERPIETAAELAALIAAVVPKSKKSRIHPATRTFQALRIAVNDELEALETALRRIPARMESGARIAIISYHSLEDRRVKNAFRQDARFDIITAKPIRPTDAEVAQNPRSRSARLRVAAVRAPQS